MTWTLGMLKKLKPGQFVYIRARVIRGTHDGQGPCAVVQLVDHVGRASEPLERFVREDQVITVAEATKAVASSMRQT